MGDGGSQLAHGQHTSHVREFRLRLVQRLFCPLTLGHVHGGPHEFHQLTGGVEYRMRYRMEVLQRAVRKNRSVIYLVIRPFTDCSLDGVDDLVSILRMNALENCFK